MKTADNILHDICNDGGVNWYTEKKILAAMKEYAKQFFTKEDMVKIVGFTIRQWSSFNEQESIGHEDLVNQWLKHECSDFIKQNYPEK